VPFIKILIGGISFLLAIILPFIGFTYANNNVLQTFFLRHFATFDQYQYTSLNAFSYWGGLHGFWVSDQSTFIGMNLRIWGYALYSIPLLITLMVLCFKKTHLDQSLLRLLIWQISQFEFVLETPGILFHTRLIPQSPPPVCLTVLLEQLIQYSYNG
jgi:hypothetical protein